MSKPKYSWDTFKLHESQAKKHPVTPKDIIVPSFEENFKIYLRVKPITNGSHRNEALKIINSKEIEVFPPYYSTEPERVYHYEEVFGQAATNEQVFEKTMIEPIANVLSGYNSTVFIYGMTGAGKTFTMFNAINEDNSDSPTNQGIVGQSLNRLFEEIQADERCNYQVILSFYEIYNENIKDLLTDSNQALNIMQDPVKGIIINDLKEICVENCNQARTVIQESLMKRSNNATKNNEYSSRSHAILQFTIRKYIPQEKSNEVAMLESKLFLIDLAGNQKAGQNQSKRFIEGVNINKSLLTLGKCINILSQQKKPAFIPFRDSKLTRILKDSLGGNSKTVMIACISPESKFYEQTLNTLKYSTKARRIKNKGKGANVKLINKKEVPRDLVVRSEHDEVDQEEKLYLLISHLQSNLQEKVRIELMRDQLETCYFQNEGQLKNNPNCEAYASNMKEINEVLSKLNMKYSLIQSTIDSQIKKFISDSNRFKDLIYKQEIVSYKLKMKDQQRQIQELKKTINDQRQTILSLTANKQKGQRQFEITHNHSQNNIAHEPLQIHKISTPTITQKVVQSNHILIHQSNGKSETNVRRSNMEISTSKNARNKENIFFLNDQKRANTPQSSLSSSKIISRPLSRAAETEKSKGPEKRQTLKPMINISMENIKLKQPNTKFESKEQTESQVKEVSENQKISPKGNKENFISRLCEIDKNMHRFTREQLKELISQYDDSGFELNKMQASMLKKLKFVAKIDDKSQVLL